MIKKEIGRLFPTALGLIVLVILASCTTTQKGSPKLKPDIKLVKTDDNAVKTYKEGNLEVLAISGGGHRAAIYSLGMLLALDDIEIEKIPESEQPNGPVLPENPKNYESLLDHVDIVSSVSGGSYGVAAYVSSYIQQQCRRLIKGEPVSMRALDILKDNRGRILAVGGAWSTSSLDIAKLAEVLKLFSLDLLDVLLINIDTLEQDFHSKITTLDPEVCGGMGALAIGQVNGEISTEVTVSTEQGPQDIVIPIPFRHLVNATNAHAGWVFSFAENAETRLPLDPNENNDIDNSYSKITGIVRKAGNVEKFRPSEIPYSYAIAASSSFPPVVSDARFTIQVGTDTKDQYMRLTDGGIADDNGIETASTHIKEWLSNSPKNSNPKALLISLDALIDSPARYASTADLENRFKILFSRNADLPRHYKKRQQKRNLREETNTQDDFSELESAALKEVIYGTSIGFSVEKDNEDHLYIDSLGFQDNPSAISTFENAGGLELTEMMAGVSEAYIQTLKRLLQPDKDEKSLLRRAKNIAFELYCSGTWIGTTGTNVHGDNCSDIFENDVGLMECFDEEREARSLVKPASVTFSNPHCDDKPSKVSEKMGASLISFANVKEQKLLSKIKSARSQYSRDYIQQFSEDVVKSLNPLTSSLGVALDTSKSNYNALTTLAYDYHTNDLAEGIAEGKLTKKNLAKINELRNTLNEDVKEYNSLNFDLVAYSKNMSRAMQEPFSDPIYGLGVEHICRSTSLNSDIAILGESCTNFKHQVFREELKATLKQATKGDSPLKALISSISPQWWNEMARKDDLAADKPKIILTELENTKLILSLNSLSHTIEDTCKAINEGIRTVAAAKELTQVYSVKNIVLGDEDMVSTASNLLTRHSEDITNCRLKETVQKAIPALQGIQLADLKRLKAHSEFFRVFRDQTLALQEKETIHSVFFESINALDVFLLEIPSTEVIQSRFRKYLATTVKKLKESLSNTERRRRTRLDKNWVNNQVEQLKKTANTIPASINPIKFYNKEKTDDKLRLMYEDLWNKKMPAEAQPLNASLCMLISKSIDCSSILDTNTRSEIQASIGKFLVSLDNLAAEKALENLELPLLWEGEQLHLAPDTSDFIECFYTLHNMQPNTLDREKISIYDYFSSGTHLTTTDPYQACQ